MEMKPEEMIVWGAAWVLSVGLHEAGHAYSADRLGDPTPGLYGRLTLNPFAHLKPVMTAIVLPLLFLVSGAGILGGATTPINPTYFKKPLRDRVLVALAGPLVNVLLTLVFCGVWLAFGPSLAESGKWLAIFILVMVQLNATLFLFNMLPVPGLDGGDVLRYFLGPVAREKFDGMRQYGIIIAVVLLSLPHVRGYFFMPVDLLLEFLVRMNHAR